MPFVRSEQRGLSTRWWATLAVAIVAVLLVLVAGLAGVNALRNAPRPTVAQATPSPSPLLPLALGSPSPAASPTALPVAATEPPPLPTPVLPPALTAASKSVATARITNTNGLGANLRTEAGGNGAVITTIQEGATVRMLGPEQRGADGRVWRQIEDSGGRQGWVLGDVLAEQPG
jgi:hypothetical protein